jgi:hypothetical protein
VLSIRKIISTVTLSLILFFVGCGVIYGQKIVDKNKGNHDLTKKGFMDGNLVGTVYYNFGEIADWQNDASRSGVWPKGTNHTYVDGVAIIVQAETKDPSGNTIHPLETNYYESTRYDPATGVTYGWWSLPGYSNPSNSSPARSDDPTTWPSSWPDRPADWAGKWNGFFGKGIFNADLETYFVFDDNEDRQYLINNNFHPDNADPSRGGLGLQVHARGFQWSQVLAEDVIFWYYEITNMSTTDYEKTLFAQYVDWGIGGHDNSSNNAGDYNELLNISYAWSTVPFGSPGNWSPVGQTGYAFLESPGISDDRVDNDQDGLTDERRENLANNFISNVNQDPFIISPERDTVLFKSYYGVSWKPHWDADENGNWIPYEDINNNGKWDAGEPLNDDVGSDGLGPHDEGYPGADPDGTEADGKPDPGEPDFGILDKDESDQLGLTGFAIYAVHKYELHNDEENWQVLSGLPTPHGQSLVGVNLANYFSSYLFPLRGRNYPNLGNGAIIGEGQTERFSMALIFGISTDDLFRRKKTVQQIYNAAYRFAKPPAKPLVTAVPGDKKVTLYWDDRAEKTFDAFYQRINFEGYRIYRSTEPNFIEDKIITDAYGKTIFRLPIAQFDLIDGVKGLHPINVNGALFYLGNDSGIKHSFVDTTVQNGQTYYYAVASYDKGFYTTNIQGQEEGIPPSESATVLKEDINGNVTKDVNTAVVTPSAPSAGYIAPQIQSLEGSGPGTGTLSIKVLNPKIVKDLNNYRLIFNEDTPFHNSLHPAFTLINTTESDTLINHAIVNGDDIEAPVVEGLSLNLKSDTSVTIDYDESGWIKGNSNYIVQLGFDSRYASAYGGKRINYPADFEIYIKGAGEGDISFPATGFSQPVQSNVVIKNLTDNIDHAQFIFRDNNENNIFDSGDAVFFTFGDSAATEATSFSDIRVGWSVSFVKDTAIAPDKQIPPQPGDVYKVITKKPFRNNEFYVFQTKGQSYDKSLAVSDLDKIAVVPNPYVGAASWEPTSQTVGRGERRIYFIHLPTECTIRIYTISGSLVKTLTHSSTLADGQESWDLISKDGMDIAFGVYIFQIDAPGIGNKIGKFAIIK